MVSALIARPASRSCSQSGTSPTIAARLARKYSGRLSHVAPHLGVGEPATRRHGERLDSGGDAPRWRGAVGMPRNVAHRPPWSMRGSPPSGPSSPPRAAWRARRRYASGRSCHQPCTPAPDCQGPPCGNVRPTKDLVWGIAAGKFSASDRYVKESVVLFEAAIRGTDSRRHSPGCCGPGAGSPGRGRSRRRLFARGRSPGGARRRAVHLFDPGGRRGYRRGALV